MTLLCTLDACCERYGIANGGAHRALHDARATARLLATLAERDELEHTWAREIERALDLRWPLGWAYERAMPRYA